MSFPIVKILFSVKLLLKKKSDIINVKQSTIWKSLRENKMN